LSRTKSAEQCFWHARALHSCAVLKTTSHPSTRQTLLLPGGPSVRSIWSPLAGNASVEASRANVESSALRFVPTTAPSAEPSSVVAAASGGFDISRVASRAFSAFAGICGASGSASTSTSSVFAAGLGDMVFVNRANGRYDARTRSRADTCGARFEGTRWVNIQVTSPSFLSSVSYSRF
jgi:hypothetical protein